MPLSLAEHGVRCVPSAVYRSDPYLCTIINGCIIPSVPLSLYPSYPLRGGGVAPRPSPRVSYTELCSKCFLRAAARRVAVCWCFELVLGGRAAGRAAAY
eukprot:696065-Prymnesium_polylepis.1